MPAPTKVVASVVMVVSETGSTAGSVAIAGTLAAAKAAKIAALKPTRFVCTALPFVLFGSHRERVRHARPFRPTVSA